MSDLAIRARRRLPRFALDFLECGTGDEHAIARNRAALDQITLNPKFLVDVSQCDTSALVFGRTYALPVGVAPVGHANSIWANADQALVQAAAKARVPYVSSSVCTTSLEEIARMADGHAWFQLYPSTEKQITDDLVRRARSAGYDVLVVTVDAPVSAKRERLVRGGNNNVTSRQLLAMVMHPTWGWARLRQGTPRLANIEPYVTSFAQLAGDAQRFGSELMMRGVTSAEVVRIRDLWPGRLVLKGILSLDTAQEAVSIGVDGLIVSNHGGRVFDAGPGAAEALGHIAREVGSKVTVMFDGGIRCGNDVLRAGALGAKMVFAGRAFLYGVAALGAPGAQRVLEILTSDLAKGLRQIGCPRFRDLDGRWLHGPADRVW